ncbi:CAP domain-containing protein [Tsuneonella sp. YG55]|uniref:CAP domain-containing protein n=1 Tax=Tsuneonella litorea TaxID=2976475 RepID=A0A9X2W209_9SPHN|nr:CAP domain-containing protein [Tsuneonella litorea]MCT2558834.1 CAP domain-containing protein [Tsuneonella litorea]
MGRVVTRGLAALAIAVTGVTALPAEAQQPSFAFRLLAAHNVERDRAGLPRLSWSSRLAQEAQAWAVVLSKKGTLEHSSNAQRRNMGENLWMGSAGYYSAETMVGGFLAERDKFRPGTFPQVSRTGNWSDVGHYTQIIWPTTTEVGCAVAKGAVNDFLVCRYNPPGNTFGEKVG